MSLLLSLRDDRPGRRGRPDRANRLRGRRGQLLLTLDHGAIAIGRGLPADADLTFCGSTQAVAAAVYAGVPLTELEGEGALTIAGDRSLAGRLTTLFPMPDKVGLDPDRDGGALGFGLRMKRALRVRLKTRERVSFGSAPQKRASARFQTES